MKKLMLAVAFVVANAHGAMVYNHTGISSPDRTITFNEVAIADQASVTTQFSGLGVSFTPSLYYNTQPSYFPTASLANSSSAGQNNPVSIFFAVDQAAAAFALQSDSGAANFAALLDGVVVEHFNAMTFEPSVSYGLFYGFTGILFDEIRVMPWSPLFFQMDNLQMRAAPAAVAEPGSLALIGLGLAGLAAARRRKQA